ALLLLSLVQAEASLDAQAYADVLSQPTEEKEAFVEGVVTKTLHGFVLSDSSLKDFAEHAPPTYDLLVGQLKIQPWICGGDTGRLCSAPATAPLNAQGWQGVYSDPASRLIFARRVAMERLDKEVVNATELEAWARTAPQDFETALGELKDAPFLCSWPCPDQEVPGMEGGMTESQRRQVFVGELAFACLCLLAAPQEVALLVLIAGAMVYADRRGASKHAEGVASKKKDLEEIIERRLREERNVEHQAALRAMAQKMVPMQSQVASASAQPMGYGYMPAQGYYSAQGSAMPMPPAQQGARAVYTPSYSPGNSGHGGLGQSAPLMASRPAEYQADHPL
ncbi:unnamed protein product, partial [Effrenium voratum]